MTDTPTLILPSAAALILAATDPNGFEVTREFRVRYMPSLPQSGATLLATFDLAVRLLDYSGKRLMLGDPEVVGGGGVPAGITVAVAVGNHVASRRADEALELYLRQIQAADQPEQHAVLAQSVAFGAIAAALDDSDEQPGT